MKKQSNTEKKSVKNVKKKTDSVQTKMPEDKETELKSETNITETVKQKKFKDAFWENVKTVFLAIILALLIRSFLFEPFRIPSGSMYPTLKVGDYLFVSKYTYGYSRFSFPGGFPLFDGRIWYSEPQRGDVVVFRFPKNTSIDYIKRIIGLPGDKIQVKQGRLYVNNKLVERTEKDRYVIDEYVKLPEYYHMYEETLPNGVKHNILEISDNERMVDNTEEFIVPQDSFFVMGDNRDRSDDSRISVGFVAKENLVGKARFLFFSHNDKGSILEPWTWHKAIRWDRFFDRIE